MTAKGLRLALTSGSIATAAFIAGQYYERNSTYNQIKMDRDPIEIIEPKTTPATFNPAKPIFASFIIPSEPQPQSKMDKVKSFVKNILPENFGSLKADSPPETYEVPLPKEGADLSVSADRAGQIAKYGLPGFTNIQTYSDYILSYDTKNKIAYWVLEHLTAESIKKNDKVDRSLCDFKTDYTIHPFFRTYNSDYKGSGYDRGHLAAAGNHKSDQKHVEDTFYLTNVAPQVGQGFNRDMWNNLEKYVRSLTKKYANVYCCTGPLFLPHKESDGKTYVKYQVIGPNYVAVPTHFYKVIVGENNGLLDLECYVMENAKLDENLPLTAFRMIPEVVEKTSGFLFFDTIMRRSFNKINGGDPYMCK